MTESFLNYMTANNVMIVEIPPNYTDSWVEPLDLSVKKPVEDFLKRKFQSWYADSISQQLKSSKAIKPVGLQVDIDYEAIERQVDN